MKFRHLAVWFSGVALLGTGATFLWAQPPQSQRVAPARTERDKLRAEIVELRTESEMLRFDYELARDGVLEELKISRSMKMAGQVMGAVGDLQVTINESQVEPSGLAPGQGSEQDRKKATEAAKAAKQEKRKAAQAAALENRKAVEEMAKEEAAFIAEQKKDLTRRFALLAEKRLDLEDAERRYRENSR
ncbi:hypothetical protein SAMN05444166_3592 [Singulisphaera sp. GP187]|uniref:hypothetical protein n=1 Tax=Singulisphaera sp. GP187 TaxID=1882752 RepID=UPI00092C6866|nr:hypothetical protein [Singulisphaera sp. GP187]SIO29851.1 hypothetical protein SAMN05444166_3592 [Singulisphaera sp. GP187]